jgi:hypothetical protein
MSEHYRELNTWLWHHKWMNPTLIISLTAWAAPLRTHPWAYPVLEVLHVLGIALLLGNLVLVELRVWGFGKDLPIAALARLSLSLVLLGFGLAAMTGVLMFMAHAQDLISNRVFLVKILLLFLAATNAAWFHTRGGLQKLDVLAKVQLIVSLVIWLTVLTLGRFISYAN